MKKTILFIISMFLVITSVSAGSLFNKKKYAKMTFIGHASFKIKTVKGTVIYIDPYYAPGDYSEPANYILVTHDHFDHNNISKCKQAKNCKIIRWRDALVNGEYKTFIEDDVVIEAVPSGGNENHGINYNVGYLVTVDGVTVYHGGDTSMLEELRPLSQKKIDYALLPVDGYYTMGPEEASEVADMIGAAHNIPIHGDGKNFPAQQEAFTAKNKLIVNFGETINLTPQETK